MRAKIRYSATLRRYREGLPLKARRRFARRPKPQEFIVLPSGRMLPAVDAWSPVIELHFAHAVAVRGPRVRWA